MAAWDILSLMIATATDQIKLTIELYQRYHPSAGKCGRRVQFIEANTMIVGSNIPCIETNPSANLGGTGYPLRHKQPLGVVGDVLGSRAF